MEYEGRRIFGWGELKSINNNNNNKIKNENEKNKNYENKNPLCVLYFQALLLKSLCNKQKKLQLNNK